MTQANDTTHVFTPLTQRRRNGRARIVPPEPEPHFQSRSQDPHILKALGRAWSWRRRLEAEEFTTIHDVAKAEVFTDHFVSRVMRLAYLSPNVLERLVISRDVPLVSVNDLIEITYLPWAKQMRRVFYEHVSIELR